jgi:hypothetical protein
MHAQANLACVDRCKTAFGGMFAVVGRALSPASAQPSLEVLLNLLLERGSSMKFKPIAA